MTEFEYLTVALSIVIGLAVTDVLSRGLALYRNRRMVTWHWSPPVWAACALLMQIQFWWAAWLLRNLPGWDFPTFSFMLLLAITLYVWGAVSLPHTPDRGIDLRRFAQDSTSEAAGAALGYFGLGLFGNIVVFDLPLFLPGTILSAIAVPFCILALGRSGPRRRTASAIGVSGVVLLFVLSFLFESEVRQLMNLGPR